MEKQEALSAKQMVTLRRYSRIFGPPSVSAAQLLWNRGITGRAPSSGSSQKMKGLGLVSASDLPESDDGFFERNMGAINSSLKTLKNM